VTLKKCRNCKANVDDSWRIPLCSDCRRAVRWAAIAGGFVCGVAVKALTHWGWL
jgi:hypothetical protein